MEAMRESKKSTKQKMPCICSWRTFMCCEIIKSGYLQTVVMGANASKNKKSNKEIFEQNKKQNDKQITVKYYGSRSKG